MPPRPNVQALTELINRGMSLSKDEPQVYQYFKGARNMLAVRTEDQDKIIGLFWDIGSFQEYSKRLKTLIRLRRPDLILLNKLKCDVEPVYEFAKEQGYEATALAGFPILEGGVAILYDPRRIKMNKKNAGHFKHRHKTFKEGDKSAIDWTWIEFSFASHYYRIISMYCKSECRKEDIRDVIKQIGEAERRRIFLMANFNRQGFTCNQMKNLVNGRPTYAKITKHEGQVVSAAYASRDGILCSAADSLHIEVENPREPFYACDAPDNGKFHFVINFAIQSDDD
ncbi:hypothetical protein WR25_18835 [Diploscapter pachys]|uniref:Endonuclease/exonuclease/phosphatase domain-containing protein n=1 Tax=Diploscapter pachys TaxID=2018661 RepID=A0A2A2KI59_9BILA|nr:hypothetical protein WR25_18835 [Diploscapter pachys]